MTSKAAKYSNKFFPHYLAWRLSPVCVGRQKRSGWMTPVRSRSCKFALRLNFTDMQQSGAAFVNNARQSTISNRISERMLSKIGVANFSGKIPLFRHSGIRTFVWLRNPPSVSSTLRGSTSSAVQSLWRLDSTTKKETPLTMFRTE